MQKLYLALIMGVGLVALSACGSPTPEALVMDMDMSEFAFTPNTIEAKVGQQVTLNLTNRGALQHEIMFGRNAMMLDGQPNGYEMDMFSMAGMEHGGFSVILPPGQQTAQMTFTVTEDMVGEWEFGCFEQDGVHYTAGMTGLMVVTP